MIRFSDTQGKTIAAGLTALAFAFVLGFVAFAVWGALRLLSFAAPALVPVLMGFFLSLFFRPFYGWCLKGVKNPTLALVVMLTVVLVPFGLLTWYAGAVMIDQVSHLVSQGPTLLHQVMDGFKATFPKLYELLGKMGVPNLDVGDLCATYGKTAIKAGSGIVHRLSGIVTILLSAIFFVSFLMTKARKGSEIVAQMPFLKEETRAFLGEQIDTFFDILVSFFQRQTVICLIEGILYGTGFALVGLPYGFMIGFALGVLNLIPFFGSVVCLPVALPVAYFMGDGSVMRVLLVLAVWGAGQILDGYFITPKIQGNKTGLGYAGVIFSFFFWGTVLGPLLGMLLAIPLSAFCVVLWRAVQARYIRPVV